MRLESATVRNYRLHRECRVEFDPARTLIGGPNESGKSTLLEAVHRALFLRAKTGGEVQRSMVSTTHGGHPEVEVTFAARGASWRVLKRFSGASGTVALTQLGGDTWTGAEAEEKLRDLLGAEAVGASANKLREQWAHLWIWQGGAGDDPTAHANTHSRDLLARLQHEGGAAAVQSAEDQRVAQAIAQRCDEILREDGKPRAGSALALAVLEEEAAQAAVAAAQLALARLERAAIDSIEAEEKLRAATAALAALEPEQRAAEQKLAQIADLRARESREAPAAEHAARQVAAASESDVRITRLRAESAEAARTLEPLAAEAQRRAEAVTLREKEALAAEAAAEAAEAAVRRESRVRDLAAAAVERWEKDAALAHGRARWQEVEQLRAELKKLESDLAALPALTPAKLQALRQLESAVGEAEAARDAMATGLDLLAADQPVRLDGRPFEPGASVTLSDDATVEIGGTRLRLRPGGGTSLAEARQRARQAAEKLRAELDRLALPQVEAAAQVLVQRQEIQARITATAGRLEALGAARLEQEISAADKALTAADAEIERRRAFAPEVEVPATLEAARTLRREADERMTAAECAADGARAERKAATARLQAARERVEEHARAVAQQHQRASDLEAQLRLLLGTHGDDDARARSLAALGAEKAAADGALAATRAALAALQPEFAEGDRQQIARALARHRELQQEAQLQGATARGELQRDGSSDPQAELALAEERAQRARTQRAREQQRAQALALLHQLFRDEQKALADQFTRPLAARISRYLECLFGPGARAEVTLEDGRFTGLRLIRPTHGGTAHAFDHLSGGAREQLAAAVRLALAEVLAEAHDGGLPVVFDDAFAYADPHRVRVLQRMLDVAAQRGLQIIVLSCQPADYAALGARSISLRAESAALPAPLAPEVVDVGRGEP